MNIEEARKLSNQQLVEKTNQLINIYNASEDSWHRKCLDEALAVLEEVAKERDIEL